MAKEIEVFEYLKKKSNIEGMDRNDLYNLLKQPGVKKQYKNLVIRSHKDNFIIISDKTQQGNKLLNCVKEYYNKIENTDCYRIRRELDVYNDIQSTNQNNGISPCVDCHIKCIEKRKNNEI